MLLNFKHYINQENILPEKEVEIISNEFEVKEIKKGSLLLQAGEVCQNTFFIEKGLLRAYTVDSNGKEHIIQFAPESWMVTNRSSMYFKEPSELYIDAIEDSQIVILPIDFVCTISSKNPSFNVHNEKALHKHIRYQQKRINLLLSATAEERYVDFITQYPDLTLRVPQWMIASYLGITPESLSRVRKKLAY